MKTKNIGEIKGYEEYIDYSVTSDGDVISHKQKTDLTLKQSNNGRGYLAIGLYNEGVCKNMKVHILVARAFVSGYKEGLEVDHINEIKIENKANNLQWLTHKKNIQKSCNKPVAQLDLKGNLIKIWKSAREAQRQGGFANNNIPAVCLGKLKTHAGFSWCYEEDLKDNLGKKTINYKKKVIQLDKNNNIIKTWESAREAQRQGGFNNSSISQACLGKIKTSGGFKWKFV